MSGRTRLKSALSLIILALSVGMLGFTAVQWLVGVKSPKIASAQCPADVSCVALTGGKADPDELAVAVGSTIQFNSADNRSHNLSLGKGGETHEHRGDYNSGDIKADEGWRVQFKQAGTFTFHDHYSPTISIIVVVYNPGGDYKITN